jgi:hypothetical protein
MTTHRVEFVNVARLADGVRYQTMQQSVLLVEERSRAVTPKITGRLRGSVNGQVQDGGRRGAIGTNVEYALPVHEGTGPRVIKPRNKKALFWKGARHPVRSVNHPGTKGKPFLRVPLEQSKGDIETMWRRAGEQILRSAAR